MGEVKRYDFHTGQGEPFMREVPNGKWVLAEDITPINKWIPIADRLPEDGGYLLVVVDRSKDGEMSLRDIGWWDGERVRYRLEDKWKGPVTHWIPLPERPE